MDDRNKPTAGNSEGDAPTVVMTRAPTTDEATVLASPARRPADSTALRPQSAQPAADDRHQTLNPLTNQLHAPYTSGGEVIKDRFIIEQELGQGGMGRVCRAVDLRKVEADDQQPYVAIKLLSAEFAQHADAFKSLQREAKKSQALAHPNIITVYDFDRDNDTIFMTMEVLEGYPLDAILKGKTDVILDRKTALRIIRQIALALEYAHSKGIVHSDLKPGNIFYTHSGQVKVLDFGIARAISSGRYTDNYDAGELNAITPKYASLEMFERQPPDPRDDIYALGLIAAELLCRKHPYRNEFATEVKAHNLQPEFANLPHFMYAQWLAKAVHVDRAARTQSASKFLSQLNWAERGPQHIAIAGVIVGLLVAVNVFIIDAVDPAIPLKDLPVAQQHAVLDNLANADKALTFQDYNGALLYLERAYKIHPSNTDIEAKVKKILADFEISYKATQDIEQKNYLTLQLQEIGNYEFIAQHKSYKKLANTLIQQQ